MPRPPPRSRPAQGARLAALRTAAGLSQAQLAEALGVRQSNVAYWETSAKPPRSDVLPAMARALGVTIPELLGAEGKPTRKPGPVGKLQRVFEQAAALPRRDQDLVERFIATLVAQHKKAS